MFQLFFIACFVLCSSITIAVLAIPRIRAFALRINILDTPSDRKLHPSPIPHLGGIGIFLGTLLPYIFLVFLDIVPISKPLFGFLIGSTAILGLGLVDDIFGLEPVIKLIGQIFVGILSYGFDIKLTGIHLPILGSISFGNGSFIITLLWIVGIMNAVNLIDGLDGLAGGVSAIAALVFSIICYVTGSFTLFLFSIALFGACIGFLKYNFSQAKIFM
jgi:UDP-GlcNAc:undecaprenyl-phosphate GlcNAc-1-phosphate transferase